MNLLRIDDDIIRRKQRFLATEEVVKAFFIAIRRDFPDTYCEIRLGYDAERDSAFCIVNMPYISDKALRIEMAEYSDVEVVWHDDTTELSSYHYEEVNYIKTKVKGFFGV